MVLYTARNRRHMEGNKRKGKGCYYETQKEDNTVEIRDWFNKEWKGKKKELRRVLRELKNRRIDKEEYVRKRREYREWYKEQKKKHEEEERILNIKSEAEAWKYINKYRKKKTERISEKINIEEWKDHFVELLDDTQGKAV